MISAEYTITDLNNRIYNFAFDYLKKKYVKVSSKNITTGVVTNYTYGVHYVVVNKTIELLQSVGAVGDVLRIVRETSTSEQIVSWNDASILKASDMSLAQLQQLHILEEYGEYMSTTSLVLDVNGQYDAKYSRIVNLLSPQTATDAVNRGYIDSFIGTLTDAQTSASLAQSWSVGDILNRPEGSSKYWAEQAKNYIDDYYGFNQNVLLESTGYGIIRGGDVTVSNMTATVDELVAHMPDGKRYERAQTTITIQTADATKPRIDLIYLSSSGVVSYLVGTAVASPVTPSTPSGGVGLYAIKIATDGTITLTDLRKFKARYQNIEYVSVLDYGAKCDGITDDTVAVQKAINSLKPVKFPAGTCLCNIILPAQFDLQGSMIETTIIKPFNIAKPVITLTGVTSWVQAKISRILFEGGTSTARAGIGFSFGRMSYTGTNDAYAGRVYFSQCGFRYFDKGVIKNFGNIGNIFEACSFYNNDYGVYSLGSKFHNTSAPDMHSGCDTYIKCEWHDNYISGFLDLDNDPGVGQFGFYDCIFQANFGFGMFFDWSTLAFDNRSPILISNCWFESNAISPSVTIDTLSGSTSKTPQDKYFSASATLNLIQLGRNKLNVGTDATDGAINVNSITDTCLASILDTNNNYFSAITFKDSMAGGLISAKSNGSGYLFLGMGTTNGINFATDSDGSTRIGRDAVTNGRSYMTYGEAMISAIPSIEGIGILQVVGDVLNYNASRARFYATRGTGENSSATGMSIGKNSTTSRSINAAGTINASGADYAEYMTKSATCGIIKAGDICGIDKNGQLTDKFSESISFCVKSTDPSYVGGDSWSSNLSYPILSAKLECETDEEYSLRKSKYESELVIFKTELEKERAKVDRIAFCGQVPVNITGATVGQYIVPIANGMSITGECVTSPTFDQYRIAVGRVIAIEDDGRARIIVKVI